MEEREERVRQNEDSSQVRRRGRGKRSEEEKDMQPEAGEKTVET